MPPKKTKAFAAIAPSGRPVLHTVRHRALYAREAAERCEHTTWDRLLKRGYRVRPVEVDVVMTRDEKRTAAILARKAPSKRSK